MPADHPLHPVRGMVDEALKSLNERFNEIYEEDGRKSIPPERLLGALLVQMFLLSAKRAAADGTTGVQPVVPWGIRGKVNAIPG